MSIITILRKPFKGTVAQNTLVHSCGGLNIDGTRIATTEYIQSNGRKVDSHIYSPLGLTSPQQSEGQKIGRWGANLILTDNAPQRVDEQSGHQVSGRAGSRSRAWGVGEDDAKARFASGNWKAYGSEGYSDSGGASRYFQHFSREEM